MLTLPYEAGTARIVYVLAALVLAGLAGGLLLGKPNEERTGRLPRALRIGLSGRCSHPSRKWSCSLRGQQVYGMPLLHGSMSFPSALL